MWCRSERSAKLRVVEMEYGEMSDDTSNLILRHLQELRNETHDLKKEVRDMRTDLSMQISALGQQVGALSTAVYSGYNEIDALRVRIERRLELSD